MKKIDLLKSVSLFWDLEQQELGYISDKMVSKNFDNGNLIFLEESEGNGLLNLAGHRSVGGMRASIYNGVPEEGVDALIDFMKEFEKNNG